MIKDELLTIIEENDISVLTKYKLDKICKYADEIEKNDNEINIVFRLNGVSIKLYGEEAKKKDETVIRIKRKDNPIRYYNDYCEKPSEEVDRITFLKRFFYYEMCDLESEYDRLTTDDEYNNDYAWEGRKTDIQERVFKWEEYEEVISGFIEFVDNDINGGDINSMEGIYNFDFGEYNFDFGECSDYEEWKEKYGEDYSDEGIYKWRRYRAGLYLLSNWDSDVLYNFPRLYYILLDLHEPTVEYTFDCIEDEEERDRLYEELRNINETTYAYWLYRILKKYIYNKNNN